MRKFVLKYIQIINKILKYLKYIDYIINTKFKQYYNKMKMVNYIIKLEK